MWNHGSKARFVCAGLPAKFVFRNEIRLLVVVPPEPVDMLVPSGMMLQVMVAGAPLPDRVPDAVVVQGAGSFGLMMKPSAIVDRNKTSNGGAQRYLAVSHIAIGRVTAASGALSAMEWRLDDSFYKTGQIVRATATKCRGSSNEGKSEYA